MLRLNVSADRRRIRRALTVHEEGARVEAARRRPIAYAEAKRYPLTDEGCETLRRRGELRALDDVVADGTGIRGGVMGGVRRADLDLDSDERTPCFPVASAKARRDPWAPN